MFRKRFYFFLLLLFVHYVLSKVLEKVLENEKSKLTEKDIFCCLFLISLFKNYKKYLWSVTALFEIIILIQKCSCMCHPMNKIADMERLGGEREADRIKFFFTQLYLQNKHILVLAKSSKIHANSYSYL